MKRPATSSRRWEEVRYARRRHGDERPRPASRTEFGADSFDWRVGERIDGPPRTYVHFLSGEMNDREG